VCLCVLRMSCPDCGHIHDSSDDEDNEDYNLYDSSEDEDDREFAFPFGQPPFFPPLLFPTIGDFFPMFPYGNPLQFMLELQRYQTQITRDQLRIQKDEERNRKRQLGAIAKTSFANELNLNERQCVICLEEFVEGTELKRLSCKHHYHSTCIDKWLVQNGKCPLCNSKAVNTLEEVQSKFSEAKKLKENAHKRMRRRPKSSAIKAQRLEEIKKFPANATGRKLKSKLKKRHSTRSLIRRRHASGLLGALPGLILPPPPMDSAMDSDEEERQIQQAIRESLKEAEDIERKEKEEKEKEAKEKEEKAAKEKEAKEKAAKEKVVKEKATKEKEIKEPKEKSTRRTKQKREK